MFSKKKPKKLEVTITAEPVRTRQQTKALTEKEYKEFVPQHRSSEVFNPPIVQSPPAGPAHTDNSITRFDFKASLVDDIVKNAQYLRQINDLCVESIEKSRNSHIEVEIVTENQENAQAVALTGDKEKIEGKINKPNNNQEKMANVTIQNALQQERTAALPKFISPPIFNPSTGNATIFLETYERTAIANGWDNAHKINFLPSFLEGPARSWYSRYSENAENATKTWDRIKDDFIKEFSGECPKAKLNIRFNARMQQPEEDIRHYYYDLLALSEELDPQMSFERFQQKFESGLHATYYEKYFYSFEPVADIESLKKLVFRLSAAKEKLDLVKANTSFMTVGAQVNQNFQNRTSSNNNAHETFFNANRNYRGQNRNNYRVNYNEDNRRQQNSRDNGQVDRHFATNTRTYDNRPKCYICNKVGHFAGSCYYNNKNHEQPSRNYRQENRHPNGPRRQE